MGMKHTTGLYRLKLRLKQLIKKDNEIFDSKGHVSLESISENRERLLKRTPASISKMMENNGYEVELHKSRNIGSKAVPITVLNSNKDRNITQILISAGSRRHGNVPYVKISTNDIGRIKIIDGEPSDYKTDGKENSVILFRRYVK